MKHGITILRYLIWATLIVLLLAMVFVLSGSAQEAEPACGVERTRIKTLQDDDALKVDFSHPIDTTVHDLSTRTAPSLTALKRADNSRFPLELKVVRVHAELLGYVHEADGDFHLVLRSGRDTMIVEIPDPVCITGGVLDRARLQHYSYESYAELRSTVEGMGGRATHKPRKLKKPVRVIVTGVAFYDLKHPRAQWGVSKNGTELHPVLKIERE